MLTRLPFGKCIVILAVIAGSSLSTGPIAAGQAQLAQMDKRFQLNDPATVTVDQQIQALAYIRSAKLAGRDKEFGDSVGGAANAQNILASIAGMDANQLSEEFILSYEGLLSTLLQVKTLQQLGQLGSAPPDAFRKATTIIHIPGRGAVQMPAVNANFAHTMIARYADERRTALGGWPDLADRHSMAISGTCPFDPGPVEIVQQDHFIVGHRNGRPLFMGSLGTNGAFAIANEARFGSMGVDESGKPVMSIPDAPSEFFKGSASSSKLSVAAQTGGDCRFEVTRAK